MEDIFDVCVVGHVTRDIVRIDGREKEMPGGTAYYLGLGLKRLGASVCVVTKIGKEDRPLLDELEQERIPILLRESPRTTVFTNIYLSGLDTREQRVGDIAVPFTSEDVAGIQARVFHLGPLTNGDIPLDMLKALSERAKISIDVQGFVRHVDESSGAIRLADWAEKEEALPCVSILKTDEAEARVVSQEADLEAMAVKLSRYGSEEVIITRGGKAALIYSAGDFYSIPSFAPRRLTDPTGCGDTFMAGYLFLRQKTNDLRQVGRFAARTASLKLEDYGPFKEGHEDLEAIAAKARKEEI